MTVLVLAAAGWGVMAIAMLALWSWQRRSGHASMVDAVWALGVGILGIAYAVLGTGLVERRIIIGSIAGFWGLRLAGYLYRRITSTQEDGRYRRFIEEWGDRAQTRLFQFYQLQAFWSVLFAFPALIACTNETPLGVLDGIGVAIAIIAIGGESLADRQLHRFRSRSDTKGKVCRDGLWRYSRHPNYFFEWVHWWAYVALGWGAALGAWTLAGPLTMYVFLTKITGIPLTEEQSIRSRGDAYREYQRTTSAFFPWFPKESDSSSSSGESESESDSPDSDSRASS